MNHRLSTKQPGCCDVCVCREGVTRRASEEMTSVRLSCKTKALGENLTYCDVQPKDQ